MTNDKRHWLPSELIDECRRQILAGTPPQNQTIAALAPALIEDQLAIVPALATIVNDLMRRPNAQCDLFQQLANALAIYLRDHRDADQKTCELIIQLQMRIVPRLIKKLDELIPSNDASS